jgi:hypothetical protein
MRKDAVYAVMLNVTLFRGMSCSIAQDPRYLRFSVLSPSGTTHYNLRVRPLFLLHLTVPHGLNVCCLSWVSGGKCAGRGGSPESDQRQHPSCISPHPIYSFLLHFVVAGGVVCHFSECDACHDATARIYMYSSRHSGIITPTVVQMIE